MGTSLMNSYIPITRVETNTKKRDTAGETPGGITIREWLKTK